MFETEIESVDFFKEKFSPCGAFKIHEEITGTIVHPRPFAEIKKVRIDMILIPTAKMIGLGWTLGPLVWSVKRPEKNLGDH